MGKTLGKRKCPDSQVQDPGGSAPGPRKTPKTLGALPPNPCKPLKRLEPNFGGKLRFPSGEGRGKRLANGSVRIAKHMSIIKVRETQFPFRGCQRDLSLWQGFGDGVPKVCCFGSFPDKLYKYF